MKKKLPSNDGIDHINIYSKGKTELGRLLTNFARTPVVTEDGKFESLEGYWYWLGSKKDKEAEDLRNAYGFDAKALGRLLNINDLPSKKDKLEFQHKIEKAMEQKVEQHPRISQLLKECDLPFEHYYVYGDKIVNVKGCDWIMCKWDCIRGALQDTDDQNE